MWQCPKCQRRFEKIGQIHSCQTKPLEAHFLNKETAKEIFEALSKEISDKVGKVEVVSIPCCIHLFGHYDFLAALPKKDRLEIRFVLNKMLETDRLKASVPVSKTEFKNCIDVFSAKEIDEELISWLKEAYYLKDKN